ncbi:glycosyl transferase family protein [Vibrio sp. N418]|uniref:glycosyltransferase n=1 Tax=Vibrio sp. (strain N418) TaxID=701176 RepID=UPI00021BE2CE|nr:glycosyltransferase [Vibrio sp. N418]EGU32219.1 glycosyl transferase family protein [Vibrio sp. N418]
MIKSDTFVSVVLIVENQTEKLIGYIDKLSPYLEHYLNDYEIVIIDQNSKDGLEQELPKCLVTHQSIRHIRLSQEESNDVALAAGLENAIGDFVINLNIESDDVEVVLPLMECALLGNDIIVCTSNKVTSYFYKKIKIISTGLLKSIGYTLPNDSTGTFCFSRRAVNAITESSRYYCKLQMRIANIGYSLHPFNANKYTHPNKRKNITRGITETLHHMVFNSTKPLRWMSFLGIMGSILAIVFSTYSLLIHLINDTVASGWTTTILFMSMLFAILFTMLSFFGEYLARLLNDRSEHKDYNVVYEKNSSVMLNEDRSNVLFTSVNSDVNKSQTGRNK